MELFVLDDGWFGKRDSDNCSLGDWTANPRKLPSGLSGLAEKYFGKTDRAVFIGILVTFLIRFACHYITGVWIWGVWAEPEYLGIPASSPWVYSALYNGWYMLFEIIITECIAMILYQALGKYFRREDLR